MAKLKVEIELSDEQKIFINEALSGKNILVDACIGSGKTTAIQRLCNLYSSDKKILYLTYNKLLKVDAKSKIRNKNVMVTNYHGFAFSSLIALNVRVGVTELVQTFNRKKPELVPYDVLILDEYQDIEQELAEMLLYIKSKNPKMQIIAVGDMEQKIYDKTSLNVRAFIDEFLVDYVKLTFTQCFRLSNELASLLGRVWGKPIRGVNEHCIVEEMSQHQVIELLSGCSPSEILCLGERRGMMTKTLNQLESEYSEKFNKKTVYASILEGDGGVEPKKTSAIFTTFDSSKGLERDICIVFDFTEEYWKKRIERPQQKYSILRNIFCVAASRGKKRIIFVKEEKELLSEKTLSTEVEEIDTFEDVNISEMFDFKYKEDVERCYSLLHIQDVSDRERTIIAIKNKDCMIDLSPCIGNYQEAAFFENYNIDSAIEFVAFLQRKKVQIEDQSLEKKVLTLTALETKQDRYEKQVEIPFISEEEREQIFERLSTVFKRKEKVQSRCRIDFLRSSNEEKPFSAIGFADVIKNDTVYELKFVSELMHTHYLQCACYMVATGIKKGILWNVRDNTKYEITIPNIESFLDAVVYAITKQKLNKYYKPKDGKDLIN